jgi:hypothetical protein
VKEQQGFIVVGFIAVSLILNLFSQFLYGFWVKAISILNSLAITDLGLGMSFTLYCHPCKR